MHAKIQKWGNSLGLRIPKSLIQEAHLAEGSDVAISLTEEGVITIHRIKAQQYNLSELLQRYPKSKSRTKEVDWGKPIGREEW